MSNWLKTLIRDMFPNAAWDVAKALIFLGVAGMITLLLHLVQRLRGVPRDVVIDLIMFVTAFLLLSVPSYLLWRRSKKLIVSPAVNPSVTSSVMVTDKAECSDTWLHEIADSHKRRIDRYVQLSTINIGDQSLTAPVPSIRFALYLSNNSVYDITVEDEIGGYILFGKHRLGGQIIVLSNNLINFPHAEEGVVIIEQRLSREEAEFIAESENAHDANFYFDHLIINVKGGRKFPEVVSQSLRIRKGIHVGGGPIILRV